MANNRIYEVVVIIDPSATEEELIKLTDTLQQIITGQGGSIVKSESMGRRTLAYEIKHKKEGFYHLFEIEGTGGEIAELERRMRVNDLVVRYMTIRIDLDRRRAEKFKNRRSQKSARKAQRKPKEKPSIENELAAMEVEG